MSKRARSPTLGLRLNFSPPRAATATSSDDMSSEFSTTSSSPVSVHSSESSCLSSSEVAEETKPTLLLGCPRCFMYVMSQEVDPRCPRCKSTVLLDLLIKKTNT